MFSVGDFVVHRNCGICQVKEIAPLAIADSVQDQLYYYLVPVNGSGSEIFSPAEEGNEQLRKVLTAKEAEELLAEIPKLQDEQFDNDKLREAHYKEALRSCDCRALVKMIKTLCCRKKERMAQGKKTTASEERYYKRASENLCNELAFALNRKRDEVESVLTLIDDLS